MRILIHSLGFKGFSVVKALSSSPFVNEIYCVIGQDAGVEDDYSEQTVALCEKAGIRYSWRTNAFELATDYDLFLAIGWRWMIRGIPEQKLIVFHDSLLPKYRGFAPLINALINKEKSVGVTALYGAADYDSGNILLQKTLDVCYPTTISAEIERISVLYADLAIELVEGLKNNKLPLSGIPQNESLASYSLWRDEEDYRINWEQPAEQIEHFINCVGYPYKGASAILNGTIIRILEAKSLQDVQIENRCAGKVIFIKEGLPVVVCSKGLLLLRRIQDENGHSLLPLMHFRARFY